MEGGRLRGLWLSDRDRWGRVLLSAGRGAHLDDCLGSFRAYANAVSPRAKLVEILDGLLVMTRVVAERSNLAVTTLTRRFEACE